MRAIKEPRITLKESKFVCLCLGCGKENAYSTKHAALLSLKKSNCASCVANYRDVRDKVEDLSLGIYKNEGGLWCSTCSGCSKEQVYTRKDHARSSSRGGWKCKNCASYENKILPSFYRDFRLADIDSFEKNAFGRGLCWKLSVDTVPDLWREQDGKCALSGLPLIKHPRTWSIDRIDSHRGYEPDNVQLVTKKVNMMKGVLAQEEFISLCTSITETHREKW